MFWLVGSCLLYPYHMLDCVLIALEWIPITLLKRTACSCLNLLFLSGLMLVPTLVLCPLHYLIKPFWVNPLKSPILIYSPSNLLFLQLKKQKSCIRWKVAFSSNPRASTITHSSAISKR